MQSCPSLGEAGDSGVSCLSFLRLQSLLLYVPAFLGNHVMTNSRLAVQNPPKLCSHFADVQIGKVW